MIVGVNKYETAEELPVEIPEVDEEIERIQIEKVTRIKERLITNKSKNVWQGRARPAMEIRM